MAKKKDNRIQQGGPEDMPPAPEAVQAAAEPAPEQAARPPATNAQVLSFWAVVLAMTAAAWLLDYLLPGVRERDTERWLMLPFGLFLVYNLYRLR